MLVLTVAKSSKEKPPAGHGDPPTAAAALAPSSRGSPAVSSAPHGERWESGVDDCGVRLPAVMEECGVEPAPVLCVERVERGSAAAPLAVQAEAPDAGARPCLHPEPSAAAPPAAPAWSGDGGSLVPAAGSWRLSATLQTSPAAPLPFRFGPPPGGAPSAPAATSARISAARGQARLCSACQLAMKQASEQNVAPQRQYRGFAHDVLVHCCRVQTTM
mmetsp:Transcript_115085/g.326024  ORF Transcript_115085/g.326024 Transcript_115085/m.326024 type:complete len:217 (+) Transcript_115085:849-1499(+)